MNADTISIDAGGDALRIRLPANCDIAETEPHLAAIKDALSGSPPGIELSAGNVAVFDTAYLQLMLSLKATAARRGVPFTVVDRSPEVERVCGLYGVHF